jgi:hypothetical protein
MWSVQAWDMVFMEKAVENLVNPSLCDENPRRMKQMTGART